MLRPYVCVACEKVILAQDGVASLVSLFSKIVINLRADAPEIPTNALAPKEWVVFSAWDLELGDELREYFLSTQLSYPDGAPFGEVGRVRMNLEAGRRLQMVSQFLAFPIGETGLYTVGTWIEENNRRVVGPIEFRIELEIVRQRQP